MVLLEIRRSIKFAVIRNKAWRGLEYPYETLAIK